MIGNWMRRVTAPLKVTFAVMIMGIAVEVLFSLLQGMFPTHETFRPLIYILPAAIAILYGAQRALQFHPAMQPEYLAWLRTTPWKPGMRLPNGPVHPVMQDAVVACLLGLTAYYYRFSRPDEIPSRLTEWNVVLALMVAAYLSSMASIFLLCGLRSFGYGLLFIVVTFFLCQFEATTTLPLCALGILIAAIGLSVSLSKYPWDRPDGKPLTNPRSWQLELHPGMFVRGWPFHSLVPATAPPGSMRLHGPWVAVLAGWIMFVLAELCIINRCFDMATSLFFTAFVIVLPIARLLTYLSGHQSPISVIGRLLTGRLIIPRFDIVFAAPAAAAVCAAVASRLVPLLADHGAAIVMACGAGASVAIIMLAGPSRRKWDLTGSYRMTRTMDQKRELVQ